MYLSLLSVSKPNIDWVMNRYRVHQRLCMAYPSDNRMTNDPYFLAPYDSSDFYCANAPRSTDTGFLYRIDAGNHGVNILVQSATLPNWNYAFQNTNLLSGIPQVREFNPTYQQGQQLQFRLIAHPVRCIGGKSIDSHGNPFAEDLIGKRIPVTDDMICNWLERRADRHGFTIVDMVEPETGYVKMDKDKATNLRLAQYNGILEVIDVDTFLQTLYSGIGHSKAWGFGLLSVK